jgi:putative transposase
MAFRHKNIRLPTTHYRGQRWYFATLCCAGRRPLLTEPKCATWVISRLREHSQANLFAVHAYCAMPDHLHVLVLGLDIESDLLVFLKELKQNTAYQFQRRFHRALWQKKFYDHILRPRDSPEQVAAYIWMNPVRKGLCRAPQDYPHSGSFAFDWKKVVPPVESWTPSWKEDDPPA